MPNELHEYNGEMLTINAIARRERISPQVLSNFFEKTKNIYESVKLLKERQRRHFGYIPYDGKLMTITSIARMEGLKPQTLLKYYEETKDIEKSVEKAKNNVLKLYGSIDYNGQKMTFTDIAAMENLTAKSLIKNYNSCGNIYEAIKKTRESKDLKHGTIEYHGEYLTLGAIAIREGIQPTSLKNHYVKTANIYEAIEKAKESQQVRQGLYVYNGQKTSATNISKLENITQTSFIRHYNKTGSVEEAINKAKEAQKKYRSLIEYYGDMLSIKNIADKENINVESLRKHYEGTGDIYEAIKLAKLYKERQNGSIEYYNEKKSIAAIARDEKITDAMLSKYLRETGDIYEAVKKAKEGQQRYQGTIPYKGKTTNINQIAKENNVNPLSLKKYYKQTGDIDKAIEITKEKQLITNDKIMYNGQFTTLTELAKNNGITRISLSKYYKKTNDINKAIELAKKEQEEKYLYKDKMLSIKEIAELNNVSHRNLKYHYNKTSDITKAIEFAKANKEKKARRIEYNGEIHTITSIAQKENVSYSTLFNYYNETGNIYDAVTKAKEARNKQINVVEYKGQIQSINSIANNEDIAYVTLKRYFELYNDIYKAVFICKEIKLRRKKTTIDGKITSYNKLSKQFGISPLELERLAQSGELEKFISEREKKETTRSEQIMMGDISLYQYCLKHSYNYSVVSRMVRVYGKTPEEAIRAYVNNGQSIPTRWIYEKYSILFKHLMLKYGLDSSKIIKDMKDEECSIEDAIIKRVFRTNNEENKFTFGEIEWMEELYDFVKNMSSEEFNEIKGEFYVTEIEEDFLREKDIRIRNILRQLLLFEFAEVMDEWTEEELLEMMKLYSITDNEKVTIVTDLYSPFKNMVIDPTDEYKERREAIKDIILNSSITNENVLKSASLSDLEKTEIIKKKELLSKIMNIKKI